MLTVDNQPRNRCSVAYGAIVRLDFEYVEGVGPVEPAGGLGTLELGILGVGLLGLGILRLGALGLVVLRMRTILVENN